MDPRSSPFLSFVYNNTDGTEHPIDWFGTGKDMRENEHFTYHLIADYLKEKSPTLHEELDEMFNAFALMERIRRNENQFYEANCPSLTPEIYKQMYFGITMRATGMMCDFLNGKWEDFVKFCGGACGYKEACSGMIDGETLKNIAFGEGLTIDDEEMYVIKLYSPLDEDQKREDVRLCSCGYMSVLYWRVFNDMDEPVSSKVNRTTFNTSSAFAMEMSNIQFEEIIED